MRKLQRDALREHKLASNDARGWLVRDWQTLLHFKGFAIGMDGDFGPKTANATNVALRWAGRRVDADVGVEDWKAVERKKRTRRPISTIRALVGVPKIIDARNGKAGFPRHPTRYWNVRLIAQLTHKLGHHTGGPASFLADAAFHVNSSYLTAGGAPAIAYTLGVDVDGTLFVFNDWQDVTWHCDGGFNTPSLGIVVRGNLNLNAGAMTAAQKRTLKLVWNALEAGTFKPFASGTTWPRLVRSTTHRHVNATSCPGTYGELYYRSISPKFEVSPKG